MAQRQPGTVIEFIRSLGARDSGDRTDAEQLAMLHLNGTKVTDAGLKELKDLKQLTMLTLNGAQVTDAGLKELKDLKQLTELYLGGTKVTDAAVKELQAALPQCMIHR